MSKDFNDFMNTQDDSMLYDTQDVQTNKVWAACLTWGSCSFCRCW